MSADLLLWLDVETSGLDPERHLILELGVIVTGWDLVEQIAARWVIGRNLVALKKNADAKAWEMHDRSGLLAEVDQSAVASFDADRGVELVMAAMEARHAAPVRWLLAGRGVHFDRSFCEQAGMTFVKKVRPRHVDVTPLHLMAAAWAPGLVPAREELPSPHRALEDLRRDLEVARVFRGVLQATAAAANLGPQAEG